MSDAREEAAIAREALVRGKKKQKKQTTLMTKWNIVLDYGESGVSMADNCGLVCCILPNPPQGVVTKVIMLGSICRPWR